MKSKTRFKWKRQLALLCLGALAYDRDRAVFVAFELDAGRVTAQQQRDIAASVEFTA